MNKMVSSMKQMNISAILVMDFCCFVVTVLYFLLLYSATNIQLAWKVQGYNSGSTHTKSKTITFARGSFIQGERQWKNSENGERWQQIAFLFCLLLRVFSCLLTTCQVIQMGLSFEHSVFSHSTFAKWSGNPKGNSKNGQRLRFTLMMMVGTPQTT